MKIGLVVRPMLTRRPYQTVKQIGGVLAAHCQDGYDLLLFPQAYLQGVYALDNTVETALKHAIKSSSKLIKQLQAYAKQYLIGIGLGFYEKDSNYAIYDSYIIINRQGEIRHLQRQLTAHWPEHQIETNLETNEVVDINPELLEPTELLFEDEEEPLTPAHLETVTGFSHGEALSVGYFGGKRLVVLLGEDYQQTEIQAAAKELEPQLLICPVALKFDQGVWQSKWQEIYNNRAKQFNCPVLLINSYISQAAELKGGAWAFGVNKNILHLPFEEIGILDVEIN